MKHKGSRCEFANERDKNLLEEYRKLLEETPFIVFHSIYPILVNRPAKRFWVSEERAAVMLSVIMNGDRLKGMSKNKREMFYEIYRRAKALLKKNPGQNMRELARQIVTQPAPKFYITPESAKIIIFHAKKRWYEEKKKKLKHLFY